MARMSDQLLEPGERLICRAHVHWWFNLWSFGLRNLFERVLVTDRRIVEKTGILAVQIRSIGLDQIETRDVAQTIWGRIFGFGDLDLHGSGGQVLQLHDIRSPTGVARAIGRAAADRRSSAARAMAKAATTSSRTTHTEIAL